jgi:hypothetical protein
VTIENGRPTIAFVRCVPAAVRYSRLSRSLFRGAFR